MSRRNPSGRSASSPKVEEKILLFFPSCSTSRRSLSRSSRHLKPIYLAKHLHQVLKPKNIGTWDATDIAKRRVKHHPFRHCLSRFFTNDDDLQCSGRFWRKFCESGFWTQNRYYTVSYCVHDIMCRSAMSWIMELRLGPECMQCTKK